MKEFEHLTLSGEEEIVLTVRGSEDCCHCKFAVAELWNGDRFIRRLDAAKRKTVKGEIGNQRLLDFYYDHEKIGPHFILRIVQTWKSEWLGYALDHGISVRVDESLQRAERELASL